MHVINTTNAPGAIGPYSQGYEANGFVFSSGQIPANPVTGSVLERKYFISKPSRSCVA